MNTKIVISPELTSISQMLSGLESLSAGVENERGISLNACVHEFMAASKLAQKSQNSADDAERCYRDVACALYLHLRENGFDADLLECVGYKGKLHDASSLLTRAIAEIGNLHALPQLMHYSVRIGNIVIDLGHRRLGEDYLHSNNGVFAHYSRFWTHINRVAAPNCASLPLFNSYANRRCSNTLLNETMLRLREGHVTMPISANYGMVVAAANSLDEAFKRAKPVRRLRNPIVTASTDDGDEDVEACDESGAGQQEVTATENDDVIEGIDRAPKRPTTR